MNIYSYLKNDHKKIEALIRAILATNDIDKRMILFDKIRDDLLLHANIEQDELKTLEDENGIEETEEEKNKEIEKYLKKLSIPNFIIKDN